MSISIFCVNYFNNFGQRLACCRLPDGNRGFEFSRGSWLVLLDQGIRPRQLIGNLRPQVPHEALVLGARDDAGDDSLHAAFLSLLGRQIGVVEVGF
jgi:hypothetical protein